MRLNDWVFSSQSPETPFTNMSHTYVREMNYDTHSANQPNRASKWVFSSLSLTGEKLTEFVWAWIQNQLCRWGSGWLVMPVYVLQSESYMWKHLHVCIYANISQGYSAWLHGYVQMPFFCLCFCVFASFWHQGLHQSPAGSLLFPLRQSDRRTDGEVGR